MFRRERRSGLAIKEKRRSFPAGRWAMLSLIGAGAATIAIQQVNQRRMQRTSTNPVPEENARDTEAAQLQPHYVEALSGPLQTQPDTSAGVQPASSEAGSKMSDASPLREREFPDASRAGKPKQNRNGSRIVDQHQMEPEAIAAGGAIGELEGDKQSFGAVPTIMDQNESTPGLG